MLIFAVFASSLLSVATSSGQVSTSTAGLSEINVPGTLEDGQVANIERPLAERTSQESGISEMVHRFMRSKSLLRGASLAAVGAGLYAVLQTEAVAGVTDSTLDHFDGIDRRRLLQWCLTTMGSEFLNYVLFYYFNESAEPGLLGGSLSALAAHSLNEAMRAPRFYKDSFPNFLFFCARMHAYHRFVDRLRASTADKDDVRLTAMLNSHNKNRSGEDDD